MDLRDKKDKPRGRNYGFLVWGLLILLWAGLGACSRESDNPGGTQISEPEAARKALVDIAQFQPTDRVVYAVKEGRALILMDMVPELEALTPLGPQGREEYLKKRALLTVTTQALGLEKFQGQGTFTVRMVQVTEYDDYDQPNWFSATPLARFEIERTAVSNLNPQSISAMPLTQVSKYVKVVEMNVSRLE